jgi:hypothetical protein
MGVGVTFVYEARFLSPCLLECLSLAHNYGTYMRHSFENRTDFGLGRSECSPSFKDDVIT